MSQQNSVVWSLPALPAPNKRSSLDALATYALNLAEALARIYSTRSTEPNKYPRSVGDLVEIVQAQYPQRQLKIGEIDAPNPDNILTGVTLRRGGGLNDDFESYVTGTQDRFVYRYAICRDVILALPPHDSLKRGELNDLLREEIAKSLTDDFSPYNISNTEVDCVADIGASAFLFPFPERRRATFEIASGVPVEEISFRYGVPPLLIEFYTKPRVMSYFGKLARQSAHQPPAAPEEH